ncbi:MAG: S6e family ribosomal protein [Candidatus Pacearchaeota archaeon]
MFKINISDKEGKTYKLELESEELVGKELHSKINGKEILPTLDGYELEITGASDKSGFTAMKGVQGIGLKKVLLNVGKAMHKKSKGVKKKNQRTKKGLRLRKTVRGQIISQEIIQINMKVLKEGSRKLSEIFPEQNKPKEKIEKTKQKAIE